MGPPNDALFLGLDDAGHVLRVGVRLVLALALGGLVGWQREVERKMAGLRTHMLVAMGAALFVLAPVELGINRDQLSRVVQGMAIGIGFLGGGTILKLTEEQRVRGLTTAATIWVTAAVGLAVGLGLLWPALLGTGLALVTLALLGKLEHHLPGSRKDHVPPDQGPAGPPEPP